jgi:hypothetical protein
MRTSYWKGYADPLIGRKSYYQLASDTKFEAKNRYEVGRSLAEGISENLKRKLEKSAAVAIEYYDVDEPSSRFWKELSDSLDESRTLLTDYKAWRKQYRPAAEDLIA